MEKNNSERSSVQVLREAIELQILKGADYNNPNSRVQQADYYVHGVWSILDTINAKYLRMVSVLETMEQGGKINFESVEDSALDLINYASFLAAYMRGQVPGQKPDYDIFNKPVTCNNLLPSDFKKDKPFVQDITEISDEIPVEKKGTKNVK